MDWTVGQCKKRLKYSVMGGAKGEVRVISEQFKTNQFGINLNGHK